ncbi:MAG: EAL domain-containing protein [Steroidobacteraceae bacterium]
MPQTILLLQDEASKAAIVHQMLAQSSDGPFVIEWIRNYTAGIDRLNDRAGEDITAVIVDCVPAAAQALEAVDQLVQASPHVPILVLGSAEHESIARRAVQRGAQDYILYDRLDSYSLSKALHNMCQRTANAESAFMEQQRMAYLAHHDHLTGLPNRLLLDDRLAQAMAAVRRQHQQLAVLFVDVDRFKYINDSLGHATGDELLVSIAGRLVASVRGSDTVSRQGGDEFVILLASIAHAEDAALSAHKILTAVEMPHCLKEHDLHVTVSLGIGVYPDDGTDVQTLIKHADIAMLNAKDNGRNNYRFFKPDVNEYALERQSIESGLRRALDRREFALHYQPKIDLETQAISGAEALISWRRPGLPVVIPEKFISVAEQCGYIVPIGSWVLREVCRQAQAWVAGNPAPTPVAINISAVELRSKNFVQRVRAILEETGLAARYLEFELSETALMQDPKSTIAVLNAIKEMGVRLTLDDFGTGYSSLSHLQGFPIDALKIDRSFVGGLCTNSGDANIVRAAINMAKSFSLRVVAEGVETREQFVALRAQHCTEGQGCFFQPPVSAKEFGKLLRCESPTAAA